MRSANDDEREDSVPPSFVCPLTLEPMIDPVTAADGHSYECDAITKWLQESNLSPLTGEALPHKRLTRSHAPRHPQIAPRASHKGVFRLHCTPRPTTARFFTASSAKQISYGGGATV